MRVLHQALAERSLTVLSSTLVGTGGTLAAFFAGGGQHEVVVPTVKIDTDIFIAPVMTYANKACLHTGQTNKAGEYNGDEENGIGMRGMLGWR
jgi:hypothetical protein